MSEVECDHNVQRCSKCVNWATFDNPYGDCICDDPSSCCMCQEMHKRLFDENGNVRNRNE